METPTTYKPFFNRIFLYSCFTIIALVLVLFIFLKYFVSLHSGIEEQYINNPKQIDIEKLRMQFREEKLQKQKEYRDAIYALDLQTDGKITQFTNNKVSFQDKGYIPENLVSIQSEYVFDTKGNGKLRTVANEALQKMAQKYYDDTGKKLVVVSSYRSYLYQKGIKDRGCPDNLCAKAGYSEHQSGLAIDFSSASTKATWDNSPKLTKIFEWLNDNAHEFGFHNTYQRGLEIDGYEIEPWHWRYLGIDFAKYLKDEGLTFAEFYNLKKNTKN